MFIQRNITNSGVIFEKISDINFFSKTLKIVTKFDLPEADELTEILLECNKHLKTLCDELLEQNPADLCKPFRAELKWHMTQILKQNTKLKEMYGRQKRGLLDIGGKLTKFVLGTMDSEDSNKIYESISTLENGQTKLLQLENQHIAVLKSNFDALSKPIAQLQNETEEIRTKLNQLIKRSNDQNEFFDRKSQLNQQVNELMSLLLIQCLHINRIQSEATEIIMTIGNKQISPLIITHDKIIETIKQSTEDKITKMESHSVIRQIAETTYTEINGQIVIKISIPMIEEEDYTLHKSYLIPFITESGYKTYHDNAEYLAVNKLKNKFIELRSSDISKGKVINQQLEDNFILCQHIHPIYSNPQTHCIPSLFINPLAKTSECELIPAQPINAIIKMENTNTWLYSIQKLTDMIIECGRITEHIKVQYEGTLTFLTKCKVSTKDFTAEVAGNPTEVEISQPVRQQDVERYRVNFEANKEQSINTTQRIRLIDSRNHNQDFLTEINKINQLKNTAEKVKLHEERTIVYRGIGLGAILLICLHSHHHSI